MASIRGRLLLRGCKWVLVCWVWGWFCGDAGGFSCAILKWALSMVQSSHCCAICRHSALSAIRYSLYSNGLTVLTRGSCQQEIESRLLAGGCGACSEKVWVLIVPFVRWLRWWLGLAIGFPSIDILHLVYLGNFYNQKVQWRQMGEFVIKRLGFDDRCINDLCLLMASLFDCFVINSVSVAARESKNCWFV